MDEKSLSDKIDIVIPWVNPSDLKWQEDKSKYSGIPFNPISADEKFYRDWNTLLYLFRSIEANMPWINKVHFLTYGHVPEWLNLDNPKLLVHNHESFFKKEHAFPVFSSDAIEMNLSSIPGLSEKFIYFNDDELVVKPVSAGRFFNEDLPVDSLVQDIPRGGWLYRMLRTKDVYPDICKNCIKPLNKVASKRHLRRERKECFYDSSYSFSEKLRNFVFNISPKYYWVRPNHSPQPLLKSRIEKCESLFGDLITETGNSRFRDKKDICHYLFRNYNLVTGDFYPRNYHDTHCIVLSSYADSLSEIEKITDYTFVCINDSEFLSHENYLKVKPILDAKLASLFPNRSSFEK
ncbi:MAG: glycosyl transferase [Bacteroidales bacterium]|nr:glycosyl transferase [Bacteroidales bacterium]